MELTQLGMTSARLADVEFMAGNMVAIL
jgi:hypothetical protein